MKPKCKKNKKETGYKYKITEFDGKKAKDECGEMLEESKYFKALSGEEGYKMKEKMSRGVPAGTGEEDTDTENAGHDNDRHENDRHKNGGGGDGGGGGGDGGSEKEKEAAKQPEKGEGGDDAGGGGGGGGGGECP